MEIKTHRFTCDVCKKNVVHESTISTGYATDDKGRKTCFECCADVDRQWMREHGKITLYLTCEPASKMRLNGHRYTSATMMNGHGRATSGKVTNWPGTLSFNVHTRCGRHNIAGTRYDCWFTFEGHQWHGVTYGDNTQVCHCRRTKAIA